MLKSVILCDCDVEVHHGTGTIESRLYGILFSSVNDKQSDKFPQYIDLWSVKQHQTERTTKFDNILGSNYCEGQYRTWI